jgi:imidazolonepropionase-like amidohydrolase
MGRSIAGVMFSWHLALALPVMALFAAGCSSVPSQKPKMSPPAQVTVPILIRGARVFDGEAVQESTDVLIVHDRIAAVGRGLTIPPDAQVIPAEGMTLMPGLIDAHTHVSRAANLRQAAIFGVTTELDMMSDHVVMKRLKEQLSEGLLPDCADLRSAGSPYTVEGGHGTEYGFPLETIADPSEARDFVRKRIAEGSDYIKLMLDDGSAWGNSSPSLTRALLEAGVAAAHAEKRLALVHEGTADEALAAVQSGVDGLMHVWVGPNSPELIKLIREQHTFVVPTLSLALAIGEQGQGDELIHDSRLAPYLSEEAIGQLQAGWGLPATIDCRQFQPIVMTLYQQKVPLLVGTDAGNSGVDHGVSIHGELRLLAQSGLSPIDALKGATSLTASIFQLSDRGRIQKGKLADLLLLRGDPTKDITATRDIVAVWKSGRKIDRESYRARIAAKRAQVRPKFPLRSIGDFESDDADAALGIAWTASSDLYLGGRSSAALDIVDGGALGTKHALRVVGTAVRSAVRHVWSGVLYSPGDFPMQIVDLSGWSQLAFWAKGDGSKLQVLFFLGSTTVPQAHSFIATPEWTE